MGEGVVSIGLTESEEEIKTPMGGSGTTADGIDLR